MTHDKAQLLAEGGYLVASNAIMRHMLPKLGEIEGKDARDAIFFYFYLLSYVDGRKVFKTTGEPNPNYGWAYPSVDSIVAALHISRRRVKPLCDLLVKYGLLETRDTMVKSKRKKFYRPLHPVTPIPTNEDGELEDDGDSVLVPADDKDF